MHDDTLQLGEQQKFSRGTGKPTSAAQHIHIDFQKSVLDHERTYFVFLCVPCRRCFCPTMVRAILIFDVRPLDGVSCVRGWCADILFFTGDFFVLGAGEIASLATALGARLGKTVTLENRVADHVLGGVRVIVGSQMVDHSLRGRLDGMKKKLGSAALPSFSEG